MKKNLNMRPEEPQITREIIMEIRTEMTTIPIMAVRKHPRIRIRDVVRKKSVTIMTWMKKYS